MIFFPLTALRVRVRVRGNVVTCRKNVSHVSLIPNKPDNHAGFSGDTLL